MNGTRRIGTAGLALVAVAAIGLTMPPAPDAADTKTTAKPAAEATPPKNQQCFWKRHRVWTHYGAVWKRYRVCYD